MTEPHNGTNNRQVDHPSVVYELDQDDTQMFGEISHILRLRDEALQHAQDLEHRLLHYFIRSPRVAPDLPPLDEENHRRITVASTSGLIPIASTSSCSVTTSAPAPQANSQRPLFPGPQVAHIPRPAFTGPLGTYSATSQLTSSAVASSSNPRRLFKSRAIPGSNHNPPYKRPSKNGNASQYGQKDRSSCPPSLIHAEDLECYRCHSRGHYAYQCSKKQGSGSTIQGQKRSIEVAESGWEETEKRPRLHLNQVDEEPEEIRPYP
ncbi:hypothetical protein GGS21DRAFT_492847 [Xylaria nigripes]|nr:hypothetical protein GGS21DRAFT_492847 [Xylaria nigripes]